MTEASAAAMPVRIARASVVRLAMYILIPAALTVWVYYPVLYDQALCFDDSEYVVNNPLVRSASWSSVGRFFGEVLHPSTIRGYYQPLSMTSLMLDYALVSNEKDLRPFHRTNLILHVLCTALVALLVWQLFDNAAIALMAGLLFGLHPLAVEPVAWIGQRKTLLAAFFCLASLSCYVPYARHGNVWLLISTGLLFVLALLSKPTSTPLPIVMLLLDYWPINRVSRRAVVEKIPLIGLSIVAAIVTFISQRDTLGVTTPIQATVEQLSLNMTYAPAFYLRLFFFPLNLSSYYPFPSPYSFSNASVAIPAAVGVVIAIGAIMSLRKTRSCFVCGSIFFVLLLPTLGIIGFTDTVAADRFAYLPMVGLVLLISSTMRQSTRQFHLGRSLLIVAIAAMESRLTREQLAHWSTSESISRHMLKSAPNSSAVWGNLAYSLDDSGRRDEAIEAYYQALRLAPNNVVALNNLAVLFEKLDRRDEAVALLQRALIARPEHAWTHFHLANLLVRSEKLDDAVVHFRRALRANPDLPEVRYNLAVVLVMMNRTDEAMVECEAALAIRSDADVHCLMGTLLQRSGRMADAMAHFQEALRLDSTHARTLAAIEATRHP